MSEQNIAMLRRALEVIARDGAAAALSLEDEWDPAVHWSPAMAGALESRTYVGHAGMRRYFDELFNVFDELRFEGIENRASGDEVMALYDMHARGRQSGAQI